MTMDRICIADDETTLWECECAECAEYQQAADLDHDDDLRQ